MNKKTIEVCYVDDDEMYGGILDALFMESEGLKVKFFSSQKAYKNSYKKTSDISFLISDYHMKGEPNGVEFVNKERHLFNFVMVTSGDDCVCHICHEHGILFIGKNRLFNFIEGIEVGVTC